MTTKMDMINQYLTHQFWTQEFLGCARVIGLRIKVEPTGYLAIVKALSAEGAIVGFVGAGSIEELYRKLQAGAGEALKWREDKFA